MSNNVTVAMTVDKYVGIPLASYDLLANRPQINGNTLTGNMTGTALGLADSSEITAETTRATEAETALGTKIGALENLTTTAKTDVVSAINEIASSASSGSSGTVDQTYSGTSANAQSGVAVKGAFASEHITSGKKTDTTLGANATAEGANNTASGYCSHAEGTGTVASGASAHAEGSGTTASDKASHAEGYITSASGEASHAEGRFTEAFGYISHAEGISTTATGYCSHAEGDSTDAGGHVSHAEGTGTTAKAYASHAGGQFNSPGTDQEAAVYSATNNAFTIGNGSSPDALSNAFRVDFSGNTYGLSAFNSSGADYAEYFEWADGNTNAEDRVGYFVTFDGAKTIKKAGANDEILGVISGTAGVIGDSYDDNWQGMYVRDDFGRLVYENVTTDDGTEKRIKLNPDYDNTLEYIPRSKRKEWGCVGLLGKLYVRDDGTCAAGGKCKCGANGIATASTDGGYRVLERVTTSIIKIFVK